MTETIHFLHSAWTAEAALSPAITLLDPDTGSEGDPVTIHGIGLAGATDVSFNGTAADFTVLSGSLITTTVPVGATTGYLVVTTPEGTAAALFTVVSLEAFNRIEAKIDGTLYGPYTVTGFIPQILRLGAMSSFGPNDHDIDDVKVGTSGFGSTELFTADFASAIVPPFDSTTGSGITATGGVMNINNGGGNAYAQVDFGADQAELYVQFTVTFHLVDPDNYYPITDVMRLYDSGLGSYAEMEMGDPVSAIWVLFGNYITVDPIVADQTYTIDVHTYHV